MKVNVVKVSEPQSITGGKVKQKVHIANSTGRAVVTLWEQDVGLLESNKSYQLNCIEVRSFQGKHQLPFPTAASIDQISDVEDIVGTPTSDKDDDEELYGITVSGIRQHETVYCCINCNRTVSATNAHIGDCTTCGTT